jgi:hypothetical protein
MTRFSPSDAALEGFRLTRERPGTILAWCAVYLAGLFVIALAMTATLGPKFVELARKGELVTAQDPEALANLLGGSWPAFIVVLLMTVLLISVIMGGIYRLVMRPEEHGFAHLRIGRDELRLAAVNLVLVLVGAAFLLLGLIVSQVAAQGGGLVAILADVALICLTVWIGVRLSLVTPMTFDSGRIAFREAWALTRRRFWPLFGMIVLAVIFYIIVWVLMSVISLGVVAISGGEQALKDVAKLTPLTGLAAVATLVLQLLLQILQIVMIYGPFAVAYQQVAKGDEAALKAF